jgi:hypothetical protein
MPLSSSETEIPMPWQQFAGSGCRSTTGRSPLNLRDASNSWKMRRRRFAESDHLSNIRNQSSCDDSFAQFKKWGF